MSCAVTYSQQGTVKIANLVYCFSIGGLPNGRVTCKDFPIAYNTCGPLFHSEMLVVTGRHSNAIYGQHFHLCLRVI
jgi:hypothetical protein